MLEGRYSLLLITKGDLVDQERKIAASGLGNYFDAIEVVSEKNAETYQRWFGAIVRARRPAPWWATRCVPTCFRDRCGRLGGLRPA